MAAEDEQAEQRPAKRQTAGKRPARKQTASKQTAKKQTASKQSDRPAKQAVDRTAPKASPSRRPKPLEVARSAGEQLRELTGRQPESTTGVERTDDGWRIELEVVETRRIPDSADILALYEVQVDEDGDLLSYRRLRRYQRGRTDPGDGGGR